MSVWKMGIVAAGSALVLAACGSSTSDGGGGGSPCTPKGGSTSGTASQVVKINPDPNTVGRFSPNNMTVKVGQSIQWVWQDPNVQHTVTSDDTTTFDSCLQSQGYKFIVTFNTAGKIPYHCTIHPLMVGSVTVTQ